MSNLYTNKQIYAAAVKAAKQLNISITTLGLRLGGSGEFFGQVQRGRELRAAKYDAVVSFLKANGGGLK